ncbi:transcriptional regulator [Nonomuraea indica]|uniref:Transcriptional regulator n=1 Tax=Nonomuraea indica TaxID=1581193 RepID=A0ABW8A8Q9_9ACTN
MDPLFDEFLHVPARLSVVALLAPAEWVDFGFLRDSVGTSDSALSKQVSALAAAGYVTVRKDQDKRARRTYVSSPHRDGWPSSGMRRPWSGSSPSPANPPASPPPTRSVLRMLGAGSASGSAVRCR